MLPSRSLLAAMGNLCQSADSVMLDHANALYRALKNDFEFVRPPPKKINSPLEIVMTFHSRKTKNEYSAFVGPKTVWVLARQATPRAIFTRLFEGKSKSVRAAVSGIRNFEDGSRWGWRE